MFDERLKETWHGSYNIVSKYPKILHCNWLRDRLTEVKYNKIHQLGILHSDLVRLIKVEFTVNKETTFWELISVRFIEGDPLIMVWLV